MITYIYLVFLLRSELPLIVVGAHSIRDVTETSDRFKYRVRRAHLHEEFNVNTDKNDIALLELDRNAYVGTSAVYASSICLPSQQDYYDDFQYGNATIAG